ncbi:MAG: agmatine deiminase family protein [Bacteroidota bacterium]
MKTFVKCTIPVFAVLLLLTFGESCTQPQTTQQTVSEPPTKPIVVRQPAEYDPQEAVWLIWPPVDHLADYSNEQVTLEIIEALLPGTRVVVTAADSTLLAKAKNAIPASAMESGRLELWQLPSEEFWARDMGPNFVQLSNGQKAIVDFEFDAWGYTPQDSMDDYTIHMEKYDEAVAKLRDLPVISSSLFSEGGNREVNGEGTLLVVESVEQGRNPNKSKAEMEAEFQRVLGVKKVIWLKQGLHEDDHTFLGPIKSKEHNKVYTVVTTNGHIDEFCRFVNDSTILLAEVPITDRSDPIGAENHRRLEANLAILQNATDQDGRPFRIVRMPLPPPIFGTMKPGDSVYDFISTLNYEDGSIFPEGQPITVVAAASYLNFLISNEVILAQQYWREGLDETLKIRDAQVKKILTDLFPDRQIEMIDALAVNFGGGGIHCITMQEPALN